MTPKEIQLERELNENKKFFGELLVELRKIKQENKQFKKQISNLKQEKECFQKENSELEQEIKQLKEEISELKDENEITKISTLITENNYLKNLVDALKRNGNLPMFTDAEIAQLNLNSFWAKYRDDSEIGKLYEQYIGYIYELDGWTVEYNGIKNTYDDLGRDLICHRDGIIHIVQCKKWSQEFKIPDKHIFQLFGSICEYRISLKRNNPNEIRKVYGVFVTTTVLSNLARSFAEKVGIDYYENFALKIFPVIKAVNNINPKLKKYYIPTDNGYEYIKLDFSKGDKYFKTAYEAENAGFHR